MNTASARNAFDKAAARGHTGMITDFDQLPPAIKQDWVARAARLDRSGQPGTNCPCGHYKCNLDG